MTAAALRARPPFRQERLRPAAGDGKEVRALHYFRLVDD